MAAIPPPSDPSAVVDVLGRTADVIVSTANGEPVTVLDAIEAAAGEGRFDRVRVHQVWALHERDYFDGRHGDALRHLSYFLSGITRRHWEAGTIDLVPNDLGSMPVLLRATTRNPVVVASASPPDKHGYVTLGANANSAAAMLDEVPVFLECNEQMPRTTGRNAVHLSQVAGWCRADYPLVEIPRPTITDTDRAIAAHVAERISDGATIQIGVGAVPDAVAGLLTEHRDLGVHTELFADGLRELVEAGAVTGARKHTGRMMSVTTDAAGTKELYDFLDGNQHVHFWPVDDTNSPLVIAQHRDFVAVNATMQVDLLGQCASESLGTHYVSSSGGQADYMHGAMLSERGQSFIVTHATANTPDGPVSRIVPTLLSGAVVTTHKNLVDKVVTEFGVAELRGRTVTDRVRALLAITHPDFRDELERSAHDLGYL